MTLRIQANFAARMEVAFAALVRSQIVAMASTALYRNQAIESARAFTTAADAVIEERSVVVA
jgi:hypothetical protein